jgi:hypothetical protein
MEPTERDNDATTSRGAAEANDTGAEPSKKPLAIADAPENPEATTKPEDQVHTLDVGEGNVVKLDALGPMIINSDGVSQVMT